MVEKYFMEKDGRRRKAIVIQCINCNKDVVSRPDQVRKFCAKACSDEGRRNRIKVNCGYCGREIEKALSKLTKSRSGLYFCRRQHKDLAQRLECEIKELHPPHYGTGKHNYREIAYRTLRKVCVGCNYCELPAMLDVHHIDGDRENNKLENLIVLCVFCHALVTRGYAEVGPDRKMRKKEN